MNNQRQRVSFDLNRPQLLTLEFDPPSQARPGKFGEQYMYWLQGDLTLWAEPELHARIVATGATAGDQLLLTKRKQRTQAGGYAVTWSAQRVNPQDVEKAREALDAGEALAAELPPPAPTHHTRRIPPSKPIERRLPPEKFAQQLHGMAAALREALDACAAVCWNPNPEDVRALAITIYIQNHGGRQR
jgi:hypothetical protein